MINDKHQQLVAPLADLFQSAGYEVTFPWSTSELNQKNSTNQLLMGENSSPANSLRKCIEDKGRGAELKGRARVHGRFRCRCTSNM